jgi:ABC-type amino acid transport substrate-binding protein
MRFCLIILLACSVIFTACAPSAPSPTGGKMRVIAEVYPPYNFVDKNNNVTGQSTEIIQAAMQKLDLKAPIEVMPLADGLNLAQKGPNIALFSVNRTPQRESLYKWAGPIGNYQQAFYAKKGSTIKLGRLEDAKTAGKIGVYKGDAGNQFLTAQGFANLDESQTDIEALKKLIDGKVQLWLGNTEGLGITALEAGVSPDTLVVLPVVVIQADLYIAFSKDVSDSSLAAWQKALDSLKQDQDPDGKTVYDKIRVRYNDPVYLQSLIK